MIFRGAPHLLIGSLLLSSRIRATSGSEANNSKNLVHIDNRELWGPVWGGNGGGVQESPNVALQQFVVMSQEGDCSNVQDFSIDPIDRGVDGDVATNMYTCNYEGAWYEVQLRSDIIIEKVVLYNNMISPTSILDTDVIIYHNGTEKARVSIGSDYDITTTQRLPEIEFDEVVGDRVRLQKMVGTMITLAEVQVLGQLITEPPTQSPTIESAPLRNWEIYQDGPIEAIPLAQNIDTTFGNHWDFAPPSHKSVNLNIPYNSSNRDYGSILLQDNCADEFEVDKSSYGAYPQPPTSLGGGFIKFDISIDIDLGLLNETGYWTTTYSSTGVMGGYVDVCVRTYLKLPDYPDAEGEVVNFVQTVVTVKAQMDGFDFNVTDISATRADAEEQDVFADYSDHVETYLCNAKSPDEPLDDDNLPTYSQGDTITVCIRGTDSEVVDVTGIESVIVSQEGQTDFSYVIDGEPITTELVSIFVCGKGETDVCIVDFQLLGRYFDEKNPKPLSISGDLDIVINYSEPSSRRRIRQRIPFNEKRTDRRIEDNSGGGGGFNLMINLSTDAYNSGQGSLGWAVLSASLALVTATALLL